MYFVILLVLLKLFRPTGSSQNQDEYLVVKEILLTGLPDKNPKPLLAALVDQDLLLYEAFSYNESSTEGHLNVRFKKVSFTAWPKNRGVPSGYHSVSGEVGGCPCTDVWVYQSYQFC